jgi:hypothetical protein
VKGNALGSLSNFAEDALLNHIFNTAYTSLATIYIALATGTLTDTSTGASMTEVANANGYARTAITFGAAASRMVIQSADVTFPAATGTWGTITDWAIVDSATYGAGNILAYGSFTASFAPVSGNTPTIPNGQIQVQMSASSGAGFVNNTVHSLFNRMFRNQAYTKPATYVGLATATIADTAAGIGDITEVTGNAYARVLVNINGGASPTWTVASGGALDNVQAITFPTPTGSWGTITSCFLIDSASGAGNIIAYDNANIVDQNPVLNDTVQFAIGAFDVTLS